MRKEKYKMDATQFKEFLKSQQEMMKMQQEMLAQMMQMNTTTSPTVRDVNTVMVPNFEVFDSSKETYKNYILRFSNYVEMRNLTSNKEYCAKLLLNSIGAKHFNLVAALAAPKTATELQYDELLTILETHLAPKRNVLVSQHKFLCRYQTSTQSIAEFVAILRADISECDFVSPCECKASVAEMFLRAQFIRGVIDNEMREKLLQSGKSKFDEIVANAISIEAAKEDAKEIACGNTNTNDATDINKVTVNRKANRFTKPNQSSKSRNKVNYQELGIAGQCLRCGRSNHFAKDCRIDISNLKCSACKRSGHVAKVCISTLLANKTNSVSQMSNQIEDDDDQSTDGIYKIVDVYKNHYVADSERYYVNVQIEGKSVRFEVDSGSGYTFLPRSSFSELKLGNQLTPSNTIFRTYLQETFVPDGKVKINVKYNNVTIKDDMYIVPDGCTALLGRTWIRRLNINLNELDSNINATNAIDKTNEIELIKREFASVFEEKIGCIPDYTISLKLRENATPVYIKERQIPYALTDRVNKELELLESSGIITKTSNSDWGSPLVVIPKADGGVRLCVDYKVGVNQRLVSAHYPIRKIDHIFNSLSNSKYFCRLDLYKAYLHVAVDDQSSAIQTISTHKGIYRMNRLSFGIKTAPAEFNRIIDQILRDIPKTESYFDDIVIHGESMAECRANLRACLYQLQKFDLHLNVSKCTFFEEKIEFLGHTIEYNKVQKSQSKVTAILKIPQPKSVEEVRRFLGMVTYYSRFIPNASTITAPIRHLLKETSKFIWTTQCQAAFNTLKNEIASDRVLMPFNPALPVQLTCDASPKGIAAVLSHLVGDYERPIAFASRSLTPAEQNYSQLDREALAIVYAVQHFHEYIFGRPFKLVTDNQPLSRIFHQNSKLPQMTSSRLQRYAAFLAGYNYEVISKKSDEIVHVDCLSRATVTAKGCKENSINQEVHLICNSIVQQINSKKLNFKSIQEETRKDAILSKIISDLRGGKITESEYTIDSNILFRGQRVVVPVSLQQLVLQELHHTHVGVTKMKQLARRYVYWMSIDRDIEKYVRSCSSCVSVQNSPAKTPLHPWEEPDSNWQRVHIDYAGPYNGHHFLVVVDSKSKWAEVGVCSAAPSSSSTIDILQTIFSRNGYPEVLVSDNATIFTSDEFTTFCTDSGIFQKFIAPGHPATNGLAERNVQTLKKKLTAMSNENLPIKIKIREIMFKYRATPLQNGKTPAEQYLGRQIRMRLDALKPTNLKKSTGPCTSARQLSVGERVQARYYTSNKPLWKLGVVVKKLGHLHYTIKLDNGYIFKRHIDQLRSTSVQNNQTRSNQSSEEPQSNIPDNEQATDEQSIFFPTVNVPSFSRATTSNVNQPSRRLTPAVREQAIEDGSHTERPTTQNTEDQAPAQNERPTRQRRPPQHLQDYVLGDGDSTLS